MCKLSFGQPTMLAFDRFVESLVNSSIFSVSGYATLRLSTFFSFERCDSAWDVVSIWYVIQDTFGTN